MFKQVKKEMPGLQESAYRREAARRMGVDYDTYLAAWKKPGGVPKVPSPKAAKPPPGITPQPVGPKKVPKNPTSLSDFNKIQRKYNEADGVIEQGLNLNHDMRATNPLYHHTRVPYVEPYSGRTLYKYKRNIGYDQNCVHVVQAHEMRRRGYSVEASKLTPKMSRELGYSSGRNASHTLAQSWTDPITGRGPVYQRAGDAGELVDTLKNMPPGARGHIKVTWNRGYSGHVMNWEVMSDGSLEWIEAQSGRKVTAITHDVLKRAKEDQLYYMRMDTLIPKEPEIMQFLVPSSVDAAAIKAAEEAALQAAKLEVAHGEALTMNDALNAQKTAAADSAHQVPERFGLLEGDAHESAVRSTATATPRQIETLNDYVNADFEHLNGILRNDPSINPDDIKMSDYQRIGDMRTWINKSELKDDLTLWRGMESDPGLKVGTTFTDQGFVSTSTNREIGEKFTGVKDDTVLVKVLAPKGTKGGAINRHFDEIEVPQSENEVILAPATRFRVLAEDMTTVNGRKVRMITVMVVP